MSNFTNAYLNGSEAAKQGQSRESVIKTVQGSPENAKYLDTVLMGYDNNVSSSGEGEGGSSGFDFSSFEFPSFEMPEPDPMDYIGNPNALYSDLKKYLPQEDAVDPSLLTNYEGSDYIWEGGSPEEGGHWSQYSPTGAYGWDGGEWVVAQGRNYYDLGYDTIYTPEGDRYEKATYDDIASARADAASSAVDLVNQQIADESQNAQLLGISYEISDDVKKNRINDAFASMWGEGSEQNYVELSNVWGTSPDSSISRGDGSTLKDEGGSTKVASKSKGMQPKTTSSSLLSASTDEGPIKSILGGV